MLSFNLRLLKRKTFWSKTCCPVMRFTIFGVGLSQLTAPSFADNQCYTAGTNTCTSALKKVKSFQSPDSTNKSLKFDSISYTSSPTALTNRSKSRLYNDFPG